MVICFGEVMGRLMPSGYSRWSQSLPGSLDFTFAGAESNVAAAIALLGGVSRFVTALPDHAIGQICQSYFRGLGVDISRVAKRLDSRLGLYYVENGVAQRGGQVVYDRAHSAFAETPPEAYDWDAIFDGACWFFTTGISPAVSRQACATTLVAMEEARRRGVKIAFDPNHRRTLWRWSVTREPEQLAKETFDQFLPHVDLLLTNLDQAADLLGIPHPKEPTLESCREMAELMHQRHGRLQWIALTMRQLHAAHDNSFGAALFEVATGRLLHAPDVDRTYEPYRITQIVDRLGTGDAFAGALLYSLEKTRISDLQTALNFATANAALSHTILGDVNYINCAEVEALVSGGGNGRVKR